jgi:hypothetical protein
MSDAKISLTSIAATQNGKTVDQNGGIHIQQPLNLIAYGKNNYGRIATPKVDVGVKYCGKSIFHGNTCKWLTQYTLGLTNNLDPCSKTSGIQINGDCHLSDTSLPSISMTVNLKDNALLAPLLNILYYGDYYQLQVTLKDGTSNKILCVNSAAMLLK